MLVNRNCCLIAPEPDPRISLRDRFCEQKRFVSRAIVRNQDVEVLIILSEHRLQCVPQILLAVEGRYDERHKRRITGLL